MNNKFSKVSCLLSVLFLFGTTAFAQLTGVKTIPGDYATINAAITDLNTQGVGAGGVIFNVAAGYTETISAPLSITATGTIGATIIFQKSGIGANPLVTAYTGGTGTPATAVQDGIWNLVGSDYVTINGIDLTENVANTGNALMEYGYALYKGSAANGCQYDTIMNCTITLNRDNVTPGVAPMLDGSVGILVINSTPSAATTPLNITSTAGSNSFNQFYSNIVLQTNTGIGLSGFIDASPFTYADHSNNIGGSAVSTGNIVNNFGGSTLSANNTAVGILTAGQYDVNISYNTINSNDGGGANHNFCLVGIFGKTADNASAVITNNTITLKASVANVTIPTNGRVCAIDNDGGSNGTTNTINISNNTITGCTVDWLPSTGFTNGFYGVANTASPSKLYINQNIFTGCTMNTVASGSYAGFFLNRGTVKDSLTLDGNSIPGFTTSPAASSPLTVRFIFNFSAAYGANCVTTFTNNTLTGFTSANTAATGTFALIFNTQEGGSLLISGNSITNITVPNTTGAVYGIYNNANSGNTDANSVIIQNNTINGFTKGTGTGSLYGIYEQPNSTFSTGSILIDNNTVNNITNNGTGAVYGIYNTGGGNNQVLTVTNNNFSNFTGGGFGYGMWCSGGGTGSTVNNNTISSLNTVSSVFGLYMGNSNPAINQNIFNNRISALSSSAPVSTSTTGIHLTQGQGINFYKNKIYDLAASGTQGKVYGFNIAGATSNSGTSIHIYNNLISDLRAPSTSGASEIAGGISGIFLGSSIALATINVSYNNIYLDAVGSGAIFNTSGIFHFGSAVASTTKLVLRDNIIVNNSTPFGTGIAAAIKQFNTNVANFDISSDNNLLYAGTPGASNALFADGTNAYQDISQYRTAFPSQGAHTVTQNVNFISTVGASPDFLRPSLVTPTPIESGAVAIAGITDDYDGVVRNATTPDIGAYEGNYVGVDTIPPVITYTALNNTSSTANRVVPSFATITDASGVNITAGTNPRIYYKKKTDADAIVGNTSLDNGWKYTEATNASSAFGFTIDYSLLQAPAAIGDTIQYFVVAQDLATIPNAGANSSVLFPSKPASVALTAAQTPVGGFYDSYAINPGLEGPIFVGTGQPYTSLTNDDAFGLFKAINLGTVTGNINAIVVSDLTESGAIALNKWNEEGTGNYNLTITPNAATERLIEGANTTMIVISGAKNVSFDGRFAGAGKYFRFRNTNTGAASTFSFTYDAIRDTIMNCYVEGASSSSGGVIILGSSNTSAVIGNDSIAILNNIIRDRSDVAGVPAYFIKCSASAGWENDLAIITGNEFMNWNNDAIAIATGGSGGNNWTISNNSFYQTAARTTNLYGIHLYSSGGSGHIITNNSIGGSAADRSGAAMSTSSTSSTGSAGIYSQATTTVGNPLIISNNTISNIANTSTSTIATLYGIYISGSIATITNNTIGGGMQAYDTLRGAGTTEGIFSTGTVTISGNLVKNIATYNSGNIVAAGIFVSGGTYTIDNNIVDSIRGNSTYNNVNASNTTIPAGIVLAGTNSATNTVSNNRISNIISMNTLGTNTAPVVVAGMLLSAGVTQPTKIFNNKISNVYGLNTTANFGNNVFGIVDLGGIGSGNSYYNNQVILGNNITDQSWVRGIALNSNLAINETFSFYNNSVYLNASLNNPNGAAAFYRLNPIPVTLKNNLFYNLSTNAGSGPVSAMHNASTSVGWSGTASDYNLNYTNNPAALNYWSPSGSSLSYADWITTTGGDLNSVTATVPFASATDLHIDGTQADAWNVFGRGIALPGEVADDYDADARSIIVGIPTTIGCDEIAAPSSIPANMVVTPATPIVGTPTIFTSAGRKIAEINWTGATAPTSLAAKYYPGVQAPGTPVGWTYEFSHIVITATPDNGDSYIGKFYYTHAEDNGIPNLAMNSIKKHNTDPYIPMGNAGTSTTDANGRYVTTNTVNDFSIITLSNHPGIVAIKLIDIKAVNAGSSNRVEWSTSDEIASDKFELEYSLDGIHFSLLSALNANGQPSAYTYWHNNAAPGKTYYRLRMLSATGDIVYSKIVWAVVKQVKGFVVTAYPNPVVNKLNVEIAGSIPANARVQLTDITGKLLQTTAVTGSITEINMSRFSAGIYFVKYTDGEENQVIKIVKQ